MISSFSSRRQMSSSSTKAASLSGADSSAAACWASFCRAWTASASWRLAMDAGDAPHFSNIVSPFAPCAGPLRETGVMRVAAPFRWTAFPAQHPSMFAGVGGGVWGVSCCGRKPTRTTGSAVEIGSPVPVPGRYQVPILYCKTYCTETAGRGGAGICSRNWESGTGTR